MSEGFPEHYEETSENMPVRGTMHTPCRQIWYAKMFENDLFQGNVLTMATTQEEAVSNFDRVAKDRSEWWNENWKWSDLKLADAGGVGQVYDFDF